MTQVFQRYYKNLTGLLFCQAQLVDSSASLGVCLHARAEDGDSIGVYSASLSIEERIFLSNFLQALGWQLLHSDRKVEEVFSQWCRVFIFGKPPGGQSNVLPYFDQSTEEVACQMRGQGKTFVFLPALGDIMQSGAVKKRVWNALKPK